MTAKDKTLDSMRSTNYYLSQHNILDS